MGKFNQAKFWKHKHGVDAFIHPCQILRDDGYDAEIVVEWCIQGISFYGVAPINGKDAPNHFQKIYIKPEEYANWEPYTPRTYL